MNDVISSLTDEILSVGRLLEVESIPDQQRVLDAEESNMLVSVDLPPGFTLKGEKSVVVEGSLLGKENDLQRVETGGDLIVRGDVRFANIIAGRVFVGGSVEHCQIAAMKRVEIVDAVSDTKMLAGDFRKQKQKLDALRRQIDKTRDGLYGIERSIDSEEKRIYRLFSNARLNIELQFGGIITMKSKRICVNLHSFYTALGDRSPKDIEQALDGFFRKGIIGVLIGKNREALKKSATRRAAFKHVLEGLHNLFTLTLSLDQKKKDIERATDEVDNEVRELSSIEPVVRLHGSILPKFDLVFALPKIERRKDQVSVDRITADFSLNTTDDEDQVELTAVSTQGDKATEKGPQKFDGMEFRLKDEKISWEPLQGS